MSQRPETDHDHGRADRESLVADHGAAKQTEPTDPLELRGARVPGGDPELMARCLVDEFAGLGYGHDDLLEIFRRPGYAVPHAYWRLAGEAAVRELIDEVLGETGVFRTSEVREPEPPPPPCGRNRKFVQIEIPGSPDGGRDGKDDSR